MMGNEAGQSNYDSNTGQHKVNSPRLLASAEELFKAPAGQADKRTNNQPPHG
jgi:hypothetical protein